MNLKIDNFEGPLDLLLHLIKENKMDIFDIQVEKITEQYLQFIQQLEDKNLEIASSYLVMASELIELKARMLLPKPVVTEEEQKVVSVDGKVLLQNINEISASKPITIKLSGLVNQEIQVTSVASSGGLIEEISDEYWLVLERLASRVGGIEALDYSTIEILY